MIASRTQGTPTNTSPALRVFDVVVETLTPLHIGTGRVIEPTRDFVIDGNELVILDIDKVLDAVDEEKLRSFGITQPPPLATLVPVGRGRKREFAAYVVPVPTGTRKPTGTEVREQIKDAFGNAYLPGSSLKGAMRTALAVMLASKKGGSWLDGHLRQLKNDKGWASIDLTKDLFGRVDRAPLGRKGDLGKASDANVDVLRALRVSDLSLTAKNTSSPFQVTEVKATKKDGPGIPIFVEAVAPNVTFRGTITVDSRLLREPALTALPAWQNLTEADLTTDLVRHCRDHSKGLITRDEVLTRQFAVVSERLEASSALMAMGWGTGWTAKTLGHLLKSRPAFQSVGERFKLSAKAPFDRARFPTTRRLTIVNDEPHQPLGWLQITITPRGER
jgi:CRISPR-associated protein Csm5